VLESAGTPVQNGTTVTFSTNLGKLVPSEARTVNGVATVEFQPSGSSGVAEIRATSGAAKPSDTANPWLKITVGAAAAGRISLTATPGTVSASGGNSTITANVGDSSGNPLQGLPVTFSTTAGSLSSAVATTDGSGNATVTLNTNREATVTASTGAGATTGKDTTTVVVRVAARPTIGISATTIGTAGSTTSFTVTPTVATGAPPIEDVRVDFGDGSSTPLGAISTATTVPHVYARPGTFVATATATDAAGTQTSASVPVVIPFALTLGISRSGNIGTFAANVNPPSTPISSFIWNFGDGDTKTTTSNTTTHDYAAAGSYSVSVVATASTGQTATATGTITIP